LRYNKRLSSVANTIFNKAAKAGASDVHIAVGSPIIFRINGELQHQGKQKNTVTKVESFIRGVLGGNGV
jgi:Tfp pilus assembly pilus retraction ATPase PilT